jgi:hypothetical protein
MDIMTGIPGRGSSPHRTCIIRTYLGKRPPGDGDGDGDGSLSLSHSLSASYVRLE